MRDIVDIALLHNTQKIVMNGIKVQHSNTDIYPIRPIQSLCWSTITIR